MAARAQQVGLFGVAVALAIIATFSNSAPRAAAAFPLPITNYIRQWHPLPGDFVFRASADVIGDAIRARSGSGRFSHVGVVVTGPSGALQVLDISPFGTGRAALHDIGAFTTEPTTSAIAVMRPRTSFDHVAFEAAATSIVQRRVPFDFAFDFADDRSLYCSELVFKVLQSSGMQWRGVHRVKLSILTIGDRDVVTPDALARSPSLAPISG